jgi:hypothetical protein
MSFTRNKSKVNDMPENKKCTHVAVNTKKNRLHITIRGDARRNELKDLYTDIRFRAADLAPGFHVIVDISECNLIYLNGMSVYKSIVDYLITKKVGRVVRIIRETTISHKQLVNFSRHIPYHTVLYATHLEEAEAKLMLAAP